MTTPHDCDPPSPDEAVAAIAALNESYIDAARRSDTSWFDDHMAEDVVIILGDGRRLGKADFLAATGQGTRSFRALTLHGATVRPFGPTVQVDADAPWELDDGRVGVSRYIDTYAWIDRRWQVISAQITLLPPSASS